METVLVVGATGNIGVAAVIAALRSKRNVLAIVRNQASASKLFQHVGTREGITTVEADVLSENGVQGVVDQVKAGKLPAFQHVYSSVGGAFSMTPLKDLSASELRNSMNTNFEPNFLTYRATAPFLLSQNYPSSTWTLVAGAEADMGAHAALAMSQGALLSLANSACYENAQSNVRVNEIYLAWRVQYDSAAEEGSLKSSEFARVYEGILSRPEIKGSRVSVYGLADTEKLQYQAKLKM